MMHNHLNLLLEQIASGKIPTEPGIVHIDVAHDDWCDLLNGRGKCNCNPEIGPARQSL
jgi:hypothetical protein